MRVYSITRNEFSRIKAEKKNPVIYRYTPIRFYGYDLTGTREAKASQNWRQCAIKMRRDGKGLQSGYTICKFAIFLRLRAGRITRLQLCENGYDPATNRK